MSEESKTDCQGCKQILGPMAWVFAEAAQRNGNVICTVCGKVVDNPFFPQKVNE